MKDRFFFSVIDIIYISVRYPGILYRNNNCFNAGRKSFKDFKVIFFYFLCATPHTVLSYLLITTIITSINSPLFLIDHSCCNKYEIINNNS